MVIRERLALEAKRQLIHTDATAVTMSVQDDGIGFDPGLMRNKGHGLSSMHARAERIGGRLAVESLVGKGTRISLEADIAP